MKNQSYYLRQKFSNLNWSKPNNQLKKLYFYVILALLLPMTVFGNGLNYSFSNPTQIISGADTFHVVDVMVAAQTVAPEKMGVGRIYFEYNEMAFGAYVGVNPSTTIIFSDTSFLLGTIDGNGIFKNYYYVVTGNDVIQTSNRFHVRWDQYVSEECLLEEISQVPRKLFSLQLKYAPGGTAFSPNLCFTTDPNYIDLVYSPCGPFTGMSCSPGNIVADCSSHVGQVIKPNNYDCGLNTSNEILEPSVDYRVFPNPTNDFLTVAVDQTQEMTYQLFGVHGSLLREGLISGQAVLETNELAVGTYFLRLNTDNVSVVERVVVAR